MCGCNEMMSLITRFKKIATLGQILEAGVNCDFTLSFSSQSCIGEIKVISFDNSCCSISTFSNSTSSKSHRALISNSVRLVFSLPLSLSKYFLRSSFLAKRFRSLTVSNTSN
ncbi:hypothetical protein XELAEV_18014753mg [Xenopus laevis]|uniref:Uncharacterized protein n=1 Tax=Xenopus laevis TaxID=8355 RepID=A0A974DH72_XENLA|nr:hypothetical protein XELAEV_18014753mg [Xenopus laevis]